MFLEPIKIYWKSRPSLDDFFYRLTLIPEFCVRYINRKSAFSDSYSSDRFVQALSRAVTLAGKNILQGLESVEAQSLLTCREKISSDPDLITESINASELRRLAAFVSKKNIWTVLLYNLIYSEKPQRILELGTAIGVSALFLSKAASSYGGSVVSVERDTERLEIAKKLCAKYEINNIQLILNDFEEYFSENAESQQFDFIFMDGAHNYDFLSKHHSKIERLLSDGGTLIYDDIHFSRGMNRFWEEVSRSPRFKTVIDLFQMGILKDGENDESIFIKYLLPTIN